MLSKWSRMKRMIGIALPTSVAFMALGYSPMVMAAEYTFMGSDTLTEVIQDALVASGTKYNPATPEVDGLSYSNTGSSQGEKNLLQRSGHNAYQSIAPMSRNFTAAALSGLSFPAPGLEAAPRTVVALDAGVIVSRTYGSRCKDMSAPLVDPADPTLAAPDSMISLVLGGPQALVMGSTAACASAARLNAIQQLASCSGIAQHSHFYRRDDSSGTTDTFKERLQTARFCNGRAPGDFGKAGSNLNNDDQDPVRRACVAGSATRAPTKCTYYPSNVTCTAGDPPNVNNVPCTQGYLVALSENDPGSDDITISIANRVKDDNFNTTMGFAGRAAVRLTGSPTAGLSVNTVNFTDKIIRQNQYMLARRLFVQHNPVYMTYPLEGVQARFDLENTLFNFIAGPPEAPNRCNIDPIVSNRGFVTCTDNCAIPPSGPGNLCSLPPSLAGSSITPALPPGAACKTANICSATGVSCGSSGICPLPDPQIAGNACSVNADCASNNCVIGSNPLAGICG